MEQLLATIEGGWGKFTSCDVRRGYDLTFDASSTATVHYCMDGKWRTGGCQRKFLQIAEAHFRAAAIERRLQRGVGWKATESHFLLANATASPWSSGTTSGRDCIRGRCSVGTNSPPMKSRPGSKAETPLNGEYLLSVKILMRGVEIARLVLEKQRRGMGLTRCMAPLGNRRLRKLWLDVFSSSQPVSKLEMGPMKYA